MTRKGKKIGVVRNIRTANHRWGPNPVANGIGNPVPLQEGKVRSTCWCDTQVILIPTTWVGVRTDTCGSPKCQPPASL